MVIENVGEQEVINMAAMAGNIDNSVVFADFFYLLNIVNSGSVVNLIPYPGQQDIQKANVGV